MKDVTCKENRINKVTVIWTGRAMYEECNIEARSRNHCCRGKAVSITYSECVSVALATRHETRMRRVILSSVACPTLPYFSTLSHKRHDFREKLSNTKCVFWFSLRFWNVSHSKKNSARYYLKYTQVFTYSPRYSCQILIEPVIFSTDFRKILKYQISRISVQCEASCSVWTDGQTWWSNQSLFAILWKCIIKTSDIWSDSV
jgi:hypothetical protein